MGDYVYGQEAILWEHKHYLCKENTNAPHMVFMGGEFTGDQWFPIKKRN